MKNRPDLIALSLLAILAFFAAAQNIFLTPTFAAMLAGLDAAVSPATRIVFSLSQYGLLATLALVVAVVMGLRRQPRDDRGRQVLVLNVASIAVAIVIVLQASVSVDFAKVAGRVMNGRTTASVTTQR